MWSHYHVFLIGGLLLMSNIISADEPLMDWSPWEKYRSTVRHPRGYVNARDLDNARENAKRYGWAKDSAQAVQRGVQGHVQRFTDEFIETMIPATTSIRCRRCPACRDKGLPGLSNGSWGWSVDDPEHLKCRICGTVFPNDEYAETVVLKAKWDGGQEFRFYGGETMKQFGHPFYRPSFTGMIRARKVGWSRSMAYRLAMAHALTGKLEYAEITRKLLLRFAEVYPHWLVLSEYGEIADIDPHVAGLCARALPADELVYPPNKPDRALYAGYWEGARAGGGGMEGGITRQFLQAYEFTCNAERADGTPLYTDEERVKIERDLLLESCVHLIGEKHINNKSVGNRIGVGMVGVSLGHPGFVRFGLEGWKLTMDEWFLADGCTPESPGYAMMSLGGIYSLAQAVRGYSDPPGYRDDKGERIDDLDLYQGRYKLVLRRMFEGLQGNLRYPPYADSYRTATLGERFAELMAANYPDNPQYLALLKEFAGPDLGKGHAETALFFRQPGLEEKSAPPLHFDDDFFPVLCLGQLRTGEHGRRSLALLNASHWGGHHHCDSLDVYYWQDGHELLTDLGYLWDHPHGGMTRRTFAHNTGMVDLRGQKTKGRGGRFHLFHVGAKVKVMAASSQAYDKADVYHRTVVQIDHAPQNSYLVDVFRLRAAGSRDLVYHGPNDNYEVSGIELRDGFAQEDAKPIRFGLRLHVGGLSDEIFVDDVSIKLADGRELAANSSATEIDKQTGKPVGWNHYSGDGGAEWGASSPGRGDKCCAYLKVTRKPKNWVNQALMHGDTNGYTGTNALEMPEGSKGQVSFWIRGRAAGCNVGLVTWPNDPKGARDRQHVGLGAVPVTSQWTQHTLDFSLLKAGMDLADVKSAPSPGAWAAHWTVADDVRFSAHHCGQKGEMVCVGDGWGQRDWRNSDLGVTIPYIVRRHNPGAGMSAFCTVYEGHKPDGALVRSAARLTVPQAHVDNVVALQVRTALGTDIVVTQLAPAEIEIETPAGVVRTDAAVAVLSVQGDNVSFAAIAKGSKLQLNGREVKAESLVPDAELASSHQP